MKYVLLAIAVCNFFLTLASTLHWLLSAEVGNTFWYHLIFVISLGFYSVIDSLEKPAKKL